MTKPEPSRRGWCGECACEVLWIDPETAVQIIGSATSIVVHVADGLICSRSLKKVEPGDGVTHKEESQS